MKRIFIFLVFFAVGTNVLQVFSQSNTSSSTPIKPGSGPSQKTLLTFSGLIPGVDMFSSEKELLKPFVSPLTEGMIRLKELMGTDLPKGAFILCNSVAEKDSVSDERYIRQGYRWIITELTPEATRQQRLEMMKARFAAQGQPIPEQMIARFASSDPKENERNLLRQTSRVVSRASLAAVSMLLQPDKAFRSSRIEDLSRSPLGDWLDVGISNYVSRNTLAAVGWTKQRIEEVYSLEDLFQMNEPFVVSSVSSGTGGVGRGNGASGGGAGDGSSGNSRGNPAGATGAIPEMRIFSAGSAGGDSGGPGGGRGRMQMPQEMIDKMNFDNQSTLVFAYFMETLGSEKMKDLIKLSREGKEVGPILEKAEYFGKALAEIEKNWLEWVKAQKAPEGGQFRMMQ